ncbi:MAG: hypothetical protein WCW26_04200 [Candidatus Buchananbacteria bacterium]
MNTRFVKATMMMLALTVFLFGCPFSQPDPDDQGTIDVGAKDTSVYLRGNIWDGAVAKALGLNDMGNKLRGKVRWLWVNLCPLDGGMGKSLEEPEKGGGNSLSFAVAVDEAGNFDGGKDGIVPNTYLVYVHAEDAGRNQLFRPKKPIQQITIAGGTETKVVVGLRLLDKYFFQCCLPGLAGQYDGEWGYATVMANWPKDVADQMPQARKQWQISWSKIDDRMLFYVDLPLDFPGGCVVVTDDTGKTYHPDLPLIPANLNWDTFSFSNVIDIPYVETQMLGALDLSLTWDYEITDSWFIRVGSPQAGMGIEFSDIESAINYGTSYTEIYLGQGEYELDSDLPIARITIIGRGPGKTTVFNRNVNRPSVFYMSSLAKGGGTNGSLGLANLKVHNGPGKRNEIYSDAAVFIEAGSLAMDNVVIENESNTGAVANYAQWVSVIHCTIVGPLAYQIGVSGDPKGIAVYNEQNVSVGDSIIGWCGTAVWCSNGEATLWYNCFWQCAALTFCERNPSWAPDQSSWVLADPMLDANQRLLPGSPCLNAAGDGYDIGVLFD